MNKQGSNGIEWCDYSWNPVTGCLNGCEYCYARKIFARFGKSFEPTMHEDKLGEPAKLKTPSRIFVGSTTDLFGDWVSEAWIEQVFEACRVAPQHKYLFLTKNPKRYDQLKSNGLLPYGHWYGTTITKAGDEYFNHYSHCTFVSIEPILDTVHLWHGDFPKWVIVGAETGNRKGRVIPPRYWIEMIVTDCEFEEVPVFMKRSLAKIWGGTLIQEFPARLRKTGIISGEGGWKRNDGN